MLTRATGITFVLFLTSSSLGFAQTVSGGFGFGHKFAPTTRAAGPLLESAERWAAEAGAATQQSNEPRTMRLSPTRLSIGLGAVVAGVVMMAIDPDQPTQPGPVVNQTLTSAATAQFTGVTASGVIALRRRVGGVVLVCEPFCPGDVDEAILDSFIIGAASGIAATTLAIDGQGWRLYNGPIQEFEERSNGLKYGGAALAVAGALIAGFWSHVPVMNQLAVSPTVGGFRVATSVGF